MTVRESGRDAVMVNCNPETVSTDYDTSDRLYFEPLTLEDVLGGGRGRAAAEGVIVQFGGQTPLKLAAGLVDAGVPLLGTSVDAIDLAEDRGRFGELLDAPRLQGAALRDRAHRRGGARAAPSRSASRCSCGPRYVLGGRAMEIVYSREGLARLPAPRAPAATATREIYLDRFLEDAIEVDVDALCDGARRVDRRDHAARRGGRRPLRRHRLRAAAALARGGDARADPRARPAAIALELGVVGLLNVQFAVARTASCT